MEKTYGFLLVATLLSGLTYGQTNLVIRTPTSTAPALYNTLVGIGTGTSITTSGNRNTVLGYFAGNGLTTGYENTFIGENTGQNNSTSYENTFVGRSAGYTNNGPGNTFVGHQAGFSNQAGNSNVFVGKDAGYSNTSGFTNVFVGTGAGRANSNGGNNVFVGMNTGTSNTSGNQNTFVGRGAGYNNTTANNNVALGWQAGYNLNTGGNNIMLGVQAGNNTSSGTNNVFAGYQAGISNISGGSNLFLGSYAGAFSNGSYNLFIGNGSGYNNTSGLGNTFIGDGSGYGNATGQNNTYIGRAANYAGNGSGTQNTFIGFQTGTGGPSVNNSTAIGVNAIVTTSNSVVLGAPGARVGIGNSAPNNSLEITKGVANQSGLRLTNMNNSTPATMLNQYKFLSVNEQGDVVMASVNSSAREGVSESLWQRKGSFLQSTQNDAVIIGANVGRTPVGYKLFVEEGILTEKVKVALKNTSEWSDYVFADTYELKGLSEVERYVKAHKHLPGVPSAKEMVAKGNDLHKTDATLLAKIEELTLYSIQLEKANRLLQQNDKKQQTELDELKQLVRQLLEKK
ncbi:hypothetical protein GCM10027592_60030 [Spirosoma flavus]